MKARYDVVAFDLYGTLLDVSGLAARIEKIVGEGAEGLLPFWERWAVAWIRL